MSPTGLLVVRLLLVANAVLVAVVGLLWLVFVEQPAAVIGAVMAWSLVAVLLACVPMTTPHRGERW